jgi:hypothetical protein
MWLEQVRDSYGTATAGDVEWEPCAVVCYITGFPVFALLSGEREREIRMGSARDCVRGWVGRGCERVRCPRGVGGRLCTHRDAKQVWSSSDELVPAQPREQPVHPKLGRAGGVLGCPIPGVPLGCPG